MKFQASEKSGVSYKANKVMIKVSTPELCLKMKSVITAQVHLKNQLNHTRTWMRTAHLCICNGGVA